MRVHPTTSKIALSKEALQQDHVPHKREDLQSLMGTTSDSSTISI